MTKRILFDLGHPGHFHLFKKAIKHFQLHSEYRVFVTTRDIPIIIQLLESENIEYHILGTKRKGLLGKLWSVVETDVAMLYFVLKNNIALGLHCGIVLSHIAIFTKMRSWIFDDDDDEVEPLMVRFSHPFSEAVFTPNCILRKTRNAVYYPGTHELSYLYGSISHPKQGAEKYSIIRLVAFNGHHDIGHGGLSNEQMHLLVEQLEHFGKVYITSERPLQQSWEKYRTHIHPSQMHEFMKNAQIIVGDSQTMISEAATMGVPAFKCNSFAGNLAVPNMLEQKYRLCFSYQPKQFDELLDAISKLLNDEKTLSIMGDECLRLREDKLDTSKMMIHLITTWKPDFIKLKELKSEDWLSLCSNFEPCREISQ